MKRVFIALCLGLVVLSVPALAQVVDGPVSPDEWQSFVAALGGVKGLTVFGIIFLAAQGGMLIVRQFITGKHKLSILWGLTTVATVVAGYTTTGSWLALLSYAPFLALVQGGIHQVLKQAKE